jgi:hypothetical protein
MDPAEVTRSILMYFILPLWLAAGFADYLCHRAAHIERTSGVKESALHLLQFAEMGVAILVAMFLEINALAILIMIACFFLHEATALWDLSYASATREVDPIEQHVHLPRDATPDGSADDHRCTLAAVPFPARIGARQL